MGLLDDLFRQIGDFWGSSSKSNNKNTTSSSSSSISSGVSGTGITKEERKNLVKVLKKFELTIKDFRPVEEAIITSGGINIKEINPKTMESKLVKGLYFAGEIMDVDSYTGGFNLQIAYSTGYTAGMHVGDLEE